MAQYEYDICVERNNCRAETKQTKWIITIEGRGEKAKGYGEKDEIYTYEGQRTNQFNSIYQGYCVNKNKNKNKN